MLSCFETLKNINYLIVIVKTFNRTKSLINTFGNQCIWGAKNSSWEFFCLHRIIFEDILKLNISGTKFTRKRVSLCNVSNLIYKCTSLRFKNKSTEVKYHSPAILCQRLEFTWTLFSTKENFRSKENYNTRLSIEKILKAISTCFFIFGGKIHKIHIRATFST